VIADTLRTATIPSAHIRDLLLLAWLTECVTILDVLVCIPLHFDVHALHAIATHAAEALTVAKRFTVGDINEFPNNKFMYYREADYNVIFEALKDIAASAGNDLDDYFDNIQSIAVAALRAAGYTRDTKGVE
jgi:hypothetical protein